MALLLSACGGGGEAAEPSSEGPSSQDLAACDSAYENGGPAALGDEKAAQALRGDLGDAGPDDNYSTDVSGYLQILAADALLLTTGGSAPNMPGHVDDAYEACTGIGWEAPK